MVRHAIQLPAELLEKRLELFKRVMPQSMQKRPVRQDDIWLELIERKTKSQDTARVRQACSLHILRGKLKRKTKQTACNHNHRQLQSTRQKPNDKWHFYSAKLPHLCCVTHRINEIPDLARPDLIARLHATVRSTVSFTIVLDRPAHATCMHARAETAVVEGRHATG